MTSINKLKLLTASSFLVLISACSHVQTTDVNPTTVTPMTEKETPAKTKHIPTNGEMIVECENSNNENYQTSYEYENFLKRNGKSLAARAAQSYHKGYTYKNYIETVAEKHNLPEEIYALAAIESDFNPKIKSNTNNATGMWQLMPKLGRDMGLVVNKKVDERKDWKKATEAALRHLGKSKDRYQSDELAVLAYYSGVGKVDKAIKKNDTNDIWVLLQDNKTFGKSEKDFIYKYMAYAEEFKKLNAKYDKVATNQ